MKMNSLRHSLSWRPALLALWLVAGGWTSMASASIFSASLTDAQWHARGSVFECGLSHAVGDYGTARFTRRAGEQEVFSLELKQTVLMPGQAQLQALWPDWRALSAPVSLGSVEITPDKKTVRLEQERARQLQQHLQAGQRLMVLRPATAQGQPPARVILESINFHSGYQQYQQCLAGLLPANFDQVKRTAVYFSSGTESLPAAERRKLDWLVRYVKADSSIQSIVIDGHTDSVGRRPDNLEVSKGRAEMIAEYLLSANIPADYLVTRWHGERYPVASNKTAQGRALNRRVTLRLERDASS